MDFHFHFPGKRYETCPECEGVGGRRIGSPIPVFYTCVRCGGKGEVPKRQAEAKERMIDHPAFKAWTLSETSFYPTGSQIYAAEVAFRSLVEWLFTVCDTHHDAELGRMRIECTGCWAGLRHEAGLKTMMK